jgi:predicted nucleotidyltransferase
MSEGDIVQAAATGAPRPIPQRKIENAVRRIVQEFQPERIILFGSYAYGRPDPDSDVDLLIVMESDERPALA